MGYYEFLSESGTFWAVRLDKSSGATLALNEESGGTALFDEKDAANAFCKYLREHFDESCSVTQVHAQFDEVPF